MISLSFENIHIAISQYEDKQYIYDVFRKKNIQLTPEEWVRQQVLHSLVQHYRYPKGLISVEKMLVINKLRKRYDAVIYDRNKKPWMLLEFKSNTIPIDESVMEQALHYNQMIQSPYFLLSNGSNTYCAQNNMGLYTWLDALPVYNF